MNACGVCGGEIAQPATGRPRVYWKNACRQRAYRTALALRNSAPKSACVTDDGTTVTKLTPAQRAWLCSEIYRRKRARSIAGQRAAPHDLGAAA